MQFWCLSPLIMLRFALKHGNGMVEPDCCIFVFVFCSGSDRACMGGYTAGLWEGPVQQVLLGGHALPLASLVPSLSLLDQRVTFSSHSHLPIPFVPTDLHLLFDLLLLSERLGYPYPSYL